MKKRLFRRRVSTTSVEACSIQGVSNIEAKKLMRGILGGGGVFLATDFEDDKASFQSNSSDPSARR